METTNEASTNHARSALLCCVEARYCAVPIEHVVETMRPLPIAPIQGALEIVRGVAIVRGAPVPVVDAARLLGGEPLSSIGRFVAVRVAERTVVLAVSSVLGVRKLAASSLHELPPLLRDLGSDVVSKLGVLDAQLLIVLGAMYLVPESLWPSLDAGAAP